MTGHGRGSRDPLPDADDQALWLVIAGAGVLAGPLAITIGFVLRRWVRERRRRLAWLSLAGSAFVVGCWPLVTGQVPLALAAAFSPQGAGWWAALGHAVWWWLAMAGLGPGLAFVFAWVIPPTIGELERRATRQAERRLAHLAADPEPDGSVSRPRTPLGRRLRAGEEASEPAGVVLGERVAGDAVLPARGRELVLPLSLLARHALVIGASGSGKTETLLRIAHEVARNSDWAVFYIDGKGDRETMRRFYALMRDAGRNPRLFPDEGYDGWRGGPADVVSRLVEVIDFAQEGPGAYYRDQAVNLIRLACSSPEGAPRCARELLDRLFLPRLEHAYLGRPEGAEVVAYTARQVAEVRARYSAFFGAIRGRLDSGWAFEDTTAGYLLLDGLRLKHEAARLARFLVEDFTQYAVERKPRERRVLLIVDEFSAIAQAGTGLVDVVERTRGFGVAAILSPQVIEGMGDPDVAARIVGSAHTILLHQIPQPEDLVAVAGTRLVMETSVQHDMGRATGLGSARLQHAYKVDPNDVRRLPIGVCFAIRAGQAATVRIHQAPQLSDVELPAQIPAPAGDAPAPPTPPELLP